MSATATEHQFRDKQQKAGAKGRVSLHPLFLDLGLTGFASVAVLITSLAMVSIFGKILGAVALAEYLLVRRIYSWLQSASMLGIDNALPRYVAMTDADRPRERDGFLVAGILCGAAVVALVVLILNGAGGTFSELFFGKKDLRDLVLALSLFLAGGDAHGIVYGFYRGRLAMKKANALQVVNLVVVPLVSVAALAWTRSTALIVDAMGGLMILFSFLFALPLLPQIVKASSRNLRAPSKTLLEYGVPRLPSILGLGAMLALGPLVASKKIPLAGVAPLLIGMSMLMGISASAKPLGQILLSKVSMFVSQNRTAELKTHLAYLQEAVIASYVFICLQLVVFTDVILRAWVGNRLSGGVVVVRLVLLSVPFYLVFSALRSVIDAKSVTPYNAFNVLIAAAAFLVFLGAAVLFSPSTSLLSSIALATVGAIAILAVLTIRTMRKLYELEINWKRSVAAIFLSIALAGVSYGIRLMIGPALNFASACGVAFVVGAMFLWLLKRAGSPWLPFFWNLAFHRGSAHV